MISIARARASRDALVRLGHPVEWHEYPMPHSVCAEEVAAIGEYLSWVFGGGGSRDDEPRSSIIQLAR